MDAVVQSGQTVPTVAVEGAKPGMGMRLGSSQIGNFRKTLGIVAQRYPEVFEDFGAALRTRFNVRDFCLTQPARPGGART